MSRQQNIKISTNAMAQLIAMQQDEITDHVTYKAIARKIKIRKTRKSLKRLRLKKKSTMKY